MNRPEISQFFPEDTTPGSMQKAFLAQPELYKYITALDAYVDWLEENYVKSESLEMQEIAMELKSMKDITDSCKTIETPVGNILIRRSNLLGDNDIKIITNEEALEAIGDQLSEEERSILRK